MVGLPTTTGYNGPGGINAPQSDVQVSSNQGNVNVQSAKRRHGRLETNAIMSDLDNTIKTLSPWGDKAHFRLVRCPDTTPNSQGRVGPRWPSVYEY